MAIQYPHYLFAPSGAAAAYQDANGDWVQPSGPTMQLIGRCREEAQIGNRAMEIQVAGGTFHKATSLIQLPKGTPKVTHGTEVAVTNDAAGVDIRIKGSVLRFEAAQLHSRLWI